MPPSSTHDHDQDHTHNHHHHQLSLPNLLPPTYRLLITTYLEEDCPTFDFGGYVVGTAPATAHLYCKSPGVLAGVPFFNEVFRQVGGCEVHWHVSEGEALSLPSPPESTSSSKTTSSSTKLHIATLTGPTAHLLQAERTALNILARASGIATATSTLSTQLRAQGFTGILAGTRKTTPGFRLVEKYAICVGGGDMHRLDLSGMIMLKDNHVVSFRRSGGGIHEAVAAARRVGGFSVKIEVECGSVDEAEEAVAAGADVVMLDNFSLADVGAVASGLKERQRQRQSSSGGGSGGTGGFLIEVSGGVTPAGIKGVDLSGWAGRVDVLSTSAVHQGVGHVDFSLKVVGDGEGEGV